MYMDLVKDDFPTIFEEVNSQAQRFLSGKTVILDVENQLDIPEELNPTIQAKLSKGVKSSVIECRFSVEYEEKECLEDPIDTMLGLNRILRMLYLPEGIEVRADLVEETSNCYFVIYYKEGIANEHVEENNDALIKRLLIIIDFMMIAMFNAKL